MDTLYKYPLDNTGESPNNLVVGEQHELPAGVNRAFVLNYGPFYSNSLTVVDETTGIVLTPNEHYVAAQLYETATVLVGKEICGVVVITDPLVMGPVRVDYQVLGGHYSTMAPLLENMVSNLLIDDRVVSWGDILGKPDVYPPTPHLHDVGDLYGFEYLVEALTNLRDAVISGDISTFEEIRANVILLNSFIEDHKNDFTNPHRVTKTQVGLGNVENYPISSKEQAELGENQTSYMTPLRVKEAITHQIGNDFNLHLNDFTNPHRVTKTQVGLGNVENFPIATTTEAQAGLREDRYMTPLRTKEAIQAFAVDVLDDHLADFENPHQVTKAQVGLGLVENYEMAKYGDVINPTRFDLYMSPLRTREMLEHLTTSFLDQRYLPQGTATNGSVRVLGSPTRIQIYAVGAWRQVWPAQWVA